MTLCEQSHSEADKGVGASTMAREPITTRLRAIHLEGVRPLWSITASPLPVRPHAAHMKCTAHSGAESCCSMEDDRRRATEVRPSQSLASAPPIWPLLCKAQSLARRGPAQAGCSRRGAFANVVLYGIGSEVDVAEGPQPVDGTVYSRPSPPYPLLDAYIAIATQPHRPKDALDPR